MSCSPFDLRDFFLKELTDPQQRQVEAHVRTCEPCREELDRLRLTEAALFSLRDEEIPQRIAFVSDPVFEPSPWRRWLGDFWGSTARLGFASAAMLSVALMVFALHRPATTTIVQAPQPQMQTVAPVSDAGIQARIDAAVAKAVGQAEARESAKTKEVVAELAQMRARMLLAAQEFDNASKRAGASRILTGAYTPPDRRPGDLQ